MQTPKCLDPNGQKRQKIIHVNDRKDLPFCALFHDASIRYDTEFTFLGIACLIINATVKTQFLLIVGTKYHFLAVESLGSSQS